MNSADSNKPIVVKRVKKYAAGAHGGAWKVAFADFVTAMMALFLVLWLIESTTPAEKMAISMYFSDPTGYTDGGSPFVINMGGGMRSTDAIDRVSSPAPPTQEPDVMPDKNVQPDVNIKSDPATQKSEQLQKLEKQMEQQEQQKQIQEMHEQKENQEFEKLKQTIEQKIEADPTIGALKDQIIIKITEDGLLIEIVDKDKRPMFDSGGTVIKSYMSTILKEISKTLVDAPNPLSVSGHTDAVPFTEVENYTNWELSSDRAHAARRAMLKAGIKEKQIVRVVGLADSQLYDKAKPTNPMNRRISILAMRTPVEAPTPPAEEKKSENNQENAEDTSGFPGGVVPGAPTEKPAAKKPVEPSLPPDTDFPGSNGATPNGAPQGIPAVPAGLTPKPVLPTAPKATNTPKPAAGKMNLPSGFVDPFSNATEEPLSFSGKPPSSNSAASTPTGNAKNGTTKSTTARPAASGSATEGSPVTAPAISTAVRSPTGSKPPATTSAPAATPPASVTVPRAKNPDEEFF